MSATTMEPVNSIWFVYNCIHAPDGEDDYCHKRSNITPCRGVRLIESTKTTQLRADVLCFRMFGFSQYRLDVVLKPQQCRASLYATMPNETKFDPRIAQFYLDNKHNASLNYEEWSPFIFVETYPDDGVWVRFEHPVPLSRVLEINFALYKQNAEGLIHYIRDEIVRLPSTGFKWTDMNAGSYIIYAYVQRAHCRLICSDSSTQKSEEHYNSPSAPSAICTTCPYTMLNFTIKENKYTTSWNRTQTLITFVKVTAIVIFVILVILLLALLSVVIYLRYIRPRRMRNRPPQNFELVSHPKLLILYTDDCHAHSEAVLQFAHFLVANASARIYMDLWDLNDPTVRATNWLINKLESVDFVLIVFSDASRRVMEGERMTEQRPFPDLFNPALRIIVSKITSIVSRAPTFDQTSTNNRTSNSRNNNRQNGNLANGSAALSKHAKEQLKRFVIIRFNYTAPESIPEDLPRLVGHLHKVELDRNSHLEFIADHQQLNAAIQAFKDYRARNPAYLKERFSANLPHLTGVDQLTGIELANPNLPEQATRTDTEMLHLIEKYGLERDKDDEHANGVGLSGDRRKDEAFPLVSEDQISTDSDDNN
ncbi:hypothetical protein M3Y97_01019700 [Aphelenchoides bicaudatus]|nr:hypothetical protein M3Y97_01019700 [Aphelenchoides bicaudatus]